MKKLPNTILTQLEKIYNETAYGSVLITWAEKGSFIEVTIQKKIRYDADGNIIV